MHIFSPDEEQSAKLRIKPPSTEEAGAETEFGARDTPTTPGRLGQDRPPATPVNPARQQRPVTPVIQPSQVHSFSHNPLQPFLDFISLQPISRFHIAATYPLISYHCNLSLDFTSLQPIP